VISEFKYSAAKFTFFHANSREFTKFHTFSRNLFFYWYWQQTTLKIAFHGLFHKKSFVLKKIHVTLPPLKGKIKDFLWRSYFERCLPSTPVKKRFREKVWKFVEFAWKMWIWQHCTYSRNRLKISITKIPLIKFPIQWFRSVATFLVFISSIQNIDLFDFDKIILQNACFFSRLTVASRGKPVSNSQNSSSNNNNNNNSNNDPSKPRASYSDISKRTLPSTLVLSFPAQQINGIDSSIPCCFFLRSKQPGMDERRRGERDDVRRARQVRLR
jgi:hypothetical protein